MYEIRKDGGVIALTEKPNYIRRHADGFYILCEEEDAQGVAVDGTVYRLMGHTGLDELEEVQLIEKDTGTVLQSSSEAVGIAFVTMTERGDIDGVTAGEHAELFSPWAYPVAYTAGQIRERGGKLYKCLRRTPRRRTGNRRTARRCGWASPTRRRNGRSGASRWAAQMPTPRAQR